MQSRERVLALLTQLGVPYTLTEHQAVFTIEEVRQIGLTQMGEVCKNLFLRDDKGRNHYLIVMAGDKQADLAALRQRLGTTRLGFASEERLMEKLGLTKGSVTPLGVINDGASAVTVVFDQDLRGMDKLGVHPNDNAATLWLSFEGLEKFVSHCGNDIRYIEV